MAVTSHDVARLAGVSQPTVSRALRGDLRVSESTRKRVGEAAEALGYVASELGRSLSTRATRQVAMLTDLDNALFPVLMPPIHDELARLGYRMVVLAERGDDMAVYERLLNRSVDGVILTTTRLRSSLPYELSRRGLPFVFLNRVSEVIESDSATVDNYGGGRLVGELLVSLGHRRIAAVLGPSDTSTVRDREAGFRSALEDAGVALPVARVHRGGFRSEDGAEAFPRLMRGRHPPTALFCVNDMVAVGFLNAAMTAGVRVPDDVAVVGFDNLDLAAWPPYDLTTVHNALVDMACASVRLLVDRLTRGTDHPPTSEVLATRLVLRGTHGP